MKVFFPLLLVLAAGTSVAEPTRLMLPGGLLLAFDAPPMTKLKEVTEGGRYQYIASSAGSSDERFNLSVFVEPLDCRFGQSIKDVSRCFLEKSDSIPGIVKQSRSTVCDMGRCEVGYATVLKLGASTVRQTHTHTIFVHGPDWVEVHLSVLNPTFDDSETIVRFERSFAYDDTECRNDKGCVEEISTSHDIGGGATIALPAGWRFYRYPVSSELKGMTSLRMEKGRVFIAIEGMPNLDNRTITEDWLRGLLRQASQENIGLSKERQFNYASISHADVIGGYTSFTSNDGERPFHVLARTQSAAVTTVIASFKQQMLFSVSIASDHSPDQDYRDAFDAVRNMH